MQKLNDPFTLVGHSFLLAGWQRIKYYGFDIFHFYARIARAMFNIFSIIATFSFLFQMIYMCVVSFILSLPMMIRDNTINCMHSIYVNCDRNPIRMQNIDRSIDRSMNTSNE